MSSSLRLSFRYFRRRYSIILSTFAVPVSSKSKLTSDSDTTGMEDADPFPSGTVVFTSVGRPYYGFDVFSVNLSSSSSFLESRLTDGNSINYNAHFTDERQTTVFISERSGAPRVYLIRPGISKPQPLPHVPTSLFHDRPVIKDRSLYFISAHQQPDKPFKSWSALYSTDSWKEPQPEGSVFTRLTPYGEADFSPAVSQSGKYVAVASYGSGPWAGDFHELKTDIVVFEAANPSKRTVLCSRGGWPTWQGDSTVFFHRQDEDGWWSIFRANLTEDSEMSAGSPSRVTPPGVHAFTPSASHDGKRIAVATRRKGTQFRHIELYNLETKEFTPVTRVFNPTFHHYSPFFSPESGYLGYHRFRGESDQGELTVPHLEPVQSPVEGPRKLSGLRMLRINGSFPSFSPSGDLIALNHDFGPKGGLKIVTSNGSKRWTVLKDRIAFYNSWSPIEKNVIYTSIGPIFESPKTTVQIARVEFDGSDLKDKADEVSTKVKILTKEETGNNAFPSVSPDGKFIVFRSGRSGFKNLYIMDSVHGEIDGEIRQLTFGECIDTMPNWSPKGDLIAFSSNRHNPNNVNAFSIYVIRPDGSGLRRIYLAGAEEADRERINHVCFSKDGEWLLFTCNIGGVTVEPVSLPNQFQPYGELYMARLDGSGLTRLTWNGYENGTPTWRTGDDEVAFDERLSLGSDVVGDKLKGDFEEPLWITCDF